MEGQTVVDGGPVACVGCGDVVARFGQSGFGGLLT